MLYLDHNKLPNIADPLVSSIKRLIPNLRSLTLSHNLLTTLPASLGTLVNLTTLDLSHNKIREWPSCLFKLDQLTVLNLGHNELERIGPDSNVQVLTKLTTLILARNRYFILYILKCKSLEYI